jgi:hypothetical protein
MRRKELIAVVSVLLVVAVAAAAESRAGVRREASSVTFPVQFHGTWNDEFTETYTAGRLTPNCGAGQVTGGVKSAIVGKAVLRIYREQFGSTVHFSWGGGSGPGAQAQAPITFAMHYEGIDSDDTACGNGITHAYNAGCRSGTTKGAVDFGDGGNVGPSNERSFVLPFGWNFTPGFDGVGCMTGIELFDEGGVSVFKRMAQRIDYLKLFRCKIVHRTPCRLTLHAAKALTEHRSGETGTEGETTTDDATAQFSWTVTIGAAK